MPLKTGRFYENAVVSIDKEKCTSCGRCARVCCGAPLVMHDGEVVIEKERWMGCIGCGMCMAVCPTGAVSVSGRDISPLDCRPLPDPNGRANYNQLMEVYNARRSTRRYANQEVDREVVDKILEAAVTAPMGLPPSDVEVMVVQGFDKVHCFAEELVNCIKRVRWMFSPGMLKIYRPFMKKDTYEMIESFAAKAATIFVDEFDRGNDYILYGAPLMLYFHASPLADPGDAYVTATYAMLAAESLGLATCMLGGAPYVLKYLGKSIKKKYGIPEKNSTGLVLVLGYPEIKPLNSIKRRFAQVKFA